MRDEEATYDVIEAAVEIGEAHGVSAAQVALAWLLGRPGVRSMVVGARTDEQLADNLAAASLELSAEERARLDELSAPPLIYPHWHQAKTAADRLGPADRAWLDAVSARGSRRRRGAQQRPDVGLELGASARRRSRPASRGARSAAGRRGLGEHGGREALDAGGRGAAGEPAEEVGRRRPGAGGRRATSAAMSALRGAPRRRT